MKALTFMLAIMIANISFGIRDEHTTHWTKKGPYKDIVKAFAGNNSISNNKDCDEYVKPVMNIMKKAHEPKHDMYEKIPNLFAKEIARIILTNTEASNKLYRFDKYENNYIEHSIRSTFMNHISKHFSRKNGKFGENGTHSRLVYKDGSDIEPEDITKILEAIITNGKMTCSKDDYLAIVLEGKVDVIQAINCVNNWQNLIVEELHGEKGTEFNKVKPIKKNNFDELRFFFQLHLAPLSGNFEGEGRFGSCYVNLLAT